MSFNADEMNPPVWMDKSFFEKVIKKCEYDENAVVLDFKIRPGTKPGDHFASVMFGADITYTTAKNKDPSNMSVIMKTLPWEDGIKKEFLADGTVFYTEIKLYTKVLRQLEHILKIADLDVVFGPKMIYHATEPYMIIVFEDITKYGYKMKPKQLDFEEAKIAYSKLAQFHATSLFMNDEGVEDLTLVTDGLFTEKNKNVSEIWMTNFTILSDILKTWDGYEIYAQKLDNIKSKIFDKVLGIYKANKSGEGYNILNHGDFHYKNMMFSDSRPNDVMLLDYQMSFWGSPSVDLIYSLYTLVKADVRETKRDQVIKYYYDEFTATLQKIGYLKKVPSLHELQLEILKNGYLEVLLVTIFLPFMMCDFSKPENDFDLSTMDLNDTEKLTDMTKKFYELPGYRDALKNMLPYYLHKGFLDL